MVQCLTVSKNAMQGLEKGCTGMKMVPEKNQINKSNPMHPIQSLEKKEDEV